MFFDFFSLKIYFKIILDLEKNCKNSAEFLYTLCPASPNVKNLHNHNTILKAGNEWYYCSWGIVHLFGVCPRCELSELFRPRALLGSVSHAMISLSIWCLLLDARFFIFLVVSASENVVFDLLGVSWGHVFSELFRLLYSGCEVFEHFGGLCPKLCVLSVTFYWSLSEILRLVSTFRFCI